MRGRGRSLVVLLGIISSRVAYPQTPVISPPYELDEKGFAFQSSPAVSGDGTGNILVVWEDNRYSTRADIFAARVSANGTVQDVPAIPVAVAPDFQSSPAAAWTGLGYLVVWADYRNSATTGYDIFGARVSAEGVVLDPGGIVISNQAQTQAYPAVACGDAGCLVVWEDFRDGSNSHVYGARVTAAGAVLDPSGIPLAATVRRQAAPAVAWNGTSYLVVWADQRNWLSGLGFDIYGARVSTTGVVLDVDGIPIGVTSDDETAPALAWDGANNLVVWEFSCCGGDSDISGARVSATGVVLDPAGISVATGWSDQSAPFVAWNGMSHLVVWSDARGSPTEFDVYGTRVGATGQLLDAELPIATSSSQEDAPVAASGGPGSMFLVYAGSGRLLLRTIEDPQPPPQNPGPGGCGCTSVPPTTFAAALFLLIATQRGRRSGE